MPCEAAYSTRAPGTIVRPATSTIGIPAAATVHDVAPAASFITPKSVAA